MTVVNKPARPDTAPALSRLLADSALSRAALSCCAVPIALIDAEAKGRPLSHANSAFQSYFGYSEKESIGRPLAALLFRGDDALVQRLLSELPQRWELSAWAKDGEPRAVEAAVASLRRSDGRLSHWVVAFSDRSEAERLRAEVESLKRLAAAASGLRVEATGQPARGAQQPRVEIAPSDELNPDRKAGSVLHQG